MSDHGKDMSSAAAVEYAANNGLVIVTPQPKELLVDIDTEEQYQHFVKMYDHLKTLIHIKNRLEHKSRRKPEGRHVTVLLGYEPTAMERVALQAILGSDPRRESYSIWRLHHNDPIPTLFYEKNEDKVNEELWGI